MCVVGTSITKSIKVVFWGTGLRLLRTGPADLWSESPALPVFSVNPCVVSTGNTQLALQIIKRNQLLPTVLHRVSPDSRKKAPQSFQSVQPIQLPSSFTQVQRKWVSTITHPIPEEPPLSIRNFAPAPGVHWLKPAGVLFLFHSRICVFSTMKINVIYCMNDGLFVLVRRCRCFNCPRELHTDVGTLQRTCKSQADTVLWKVHLTEQTSISDIVAVNQTGNVLKSSSAPYSGHSQQSLSDIFHCPSTQKLFGHKIFSGVSSLCCFFLFPYNPLWLWRTFCWIITLTDSPTTGLTYASSLW